MITARNGPVQALVAAISYDPIVHIPIGPLRLSPHGIGIAVGFLLGARLMLPEAKRKGISEEAVYTVLIRAAIGAMVGARLAYVVNHIGDYADRPLDIFKVWEGGISLLGGIFGAIILALPLMRKLGLDVWFHNFSSISEFSWMTRERVTPIGQTAEGTFGKFQNGDRPDRVQVFESDLLRVREIA